MKKTTSRTRGLLHAIRRAERKVLVAWIRFSQKHRNSIWLPIGLFCLLYSDGFVMIVPSMICLIVAVTISPHRWLLFALLFSTAATLNNATTYFIGRMISARVIHEQISHYHLNEMWQKAQEALQSYGPWGAFIGSLIGLPTQMITAMIGIADAQVKAANPELQGIFVPVILLLLLGHTIKSFLVAGLARYGWLKLERKITKEEQISLK